MWVFRYFRFYERVKNCYDIINKKKNKKNY